MDIRVFSGGQMRIFSDTEETFDALFGWGCDGIAAYGTVGVAFFCGVGGAAMVSLHTGRWGVGGWGCSLQDGIWFNGGAVSPKKDAINQYNTVSCLTCVFVLCLYTL